MSNKTSTQEKIEVMQAFVAGKTIEFRGKGTRTWYCNDDPIWNWELFEYRIKPPELVECWINIYPDGTRAYHHTEERANQTLHPQRVRCVHMKEVIE